MGQEKEKKKLIVLTGPTASGKTALSVRLAERIGGEIISADSMQVYRGMDIGSAKIRPEEMRGVPHHLIDALEPDESFDAARFQHLAKKAMDGIWSRGHIPILAGGTGFYIQGVVYDVDFTENDGDMSLRRELEAIGREPSGKERLHEMLRRVDPDAAEQIHPNNVKRTIRAIEYHQQTGQTMSAHNREERGKTSPYKFVYFVLEDEREVLYRRIDQRVKEMIRQGLEEEVRTLRARGVTREMTSMQGLGYKEMMDYLDGLIPYEEAVRRIQRDTRHFAKRQLTWFRRERDVTWIRKQDYGRDPDRILAAMLAILQQRGIIQTEE